jgi:hypothetical protein
MARMINRSDFIGVVNISEHCKEGDEILNQFIEERQNLDLPALLGNCFLEEILDNLTTSEYQDLINGGIYVVDGKKRRHFGIKRVLIHYVFAAYVYRGGMVDTPFSFVQKQSQDSIPVPMSDLRSLHDENRKMAYDYWLMTYDYLCNNKSLFECFDDCDCPKECSGCENGCNECSGGKPNNTRGYRMKVISR